MKIGTTLSLFNKWYDTYECLKRIKKIGFDTVDLNFGQQPDLKGKNEFDYYTDIKKFALDINLDICQAHAPMIKTAQVDSSLFFSDEFLTKTTTAIKMSGLLNIPYLVIHPFVLYPEGYKNKGYKYEDVKDKIKEDILRFFKRLSTCIDDSNIKIAIENMYAYDFMGRKVVNTVCSTPEEMNDFIDILGKDKFVACLDVGHANLIKNIKISQFIEKLGDNLKILHISDNFGALNDWFGEFDRHNPPFIGSVDWADVMKGLNNINYKGVFNMECNGYAPKELTEIYAEYIFKSAKYIINNF